MTAALLADLRALADDRSLRCVGHGGISVRRLRGRIAYLIAKHAPKPDVSERDELAQVIGQHPDVTDRSADDGCFCGEHSDPRTYEEHLARKQAAALAPLIAAREAAALREAAGALDLSGYYDPTATGGVSTSCFVAENAARDALNKRADRIEAGDE